ncbi:MAG: hypothetical protein Q9163_003030 [Psora crenata]
MPLTEADQRRVDEAEAQAEAAGSSKLLVRVPQDQKKLGLITVACLILNRTIGSGIYVTPALVLKATNSVGISLLLWTLGGIFGMSGLLIWLELGQSIPKFKPSDELPPPQTEDEGALENVPRSGGEKNYLEYIYKHPRFRSTCMYGLPFIVLGNLAGNALTFGMFVMEAAGVRDHDSAVRALAVAALTFACLLHGMWRQGGIVVNNVLAIIKVLNLLAIIVIGFAAGASGSFGNGPARKPAGGENFNVHNSFAHARRGVADYSSSILFIVYSYSGFKQPFYVLSEVAQPKKPFIKTTIATMGLVVVIFFLANVAYLCAIPKNVYLEADRDLAVVFFGEIFGYEVAPRVMSGIIALSILGNIVVMTFTACRGEFACGLMKIGSLSRLILMVISSRQSNKKLPKKKRFWGSVDDRALEQSPAPALVLHWVFSVILIGATSSKPPRSAFTFLASVYAYTLVVIVGFFVASGVLYLRFSKREQWMKYVGFRPWGGPVWAAIYSIICAFLIVTHFLPPSASSPFAFSHTGVQHWVAPTVGLGAVLLAYVYYIFFAKLLPRLKKQELIVEREPVIVRQGGRADGDWVQVMEIVEFWWAARERTPKEA